MVTVGDDVSAVEADLVRGRLACPGCGGELRGWGSARNRPVRHGLAAGGRVRWHRPRRARCCGCGSTHVLLPVSLAARRADAAEVIAAAVDAKVARGRGHRRVAAWLGRPVSTVRGWLRGFARASDAITERFAVLIMRDAPDAAALWPAPQWHATGQALTSLMGYAAAVAARFGIGRLAWQLTGITVTNGWLFSAAWWARAGQHELAPYRGLGGSAGSRSGPHPW